MRRSFSLWTKYYIIRSSITPGLLHMSPISKTSTSLNIMWPKQLKDIKQKLYSSISIYLRESYKKLIYANLCQNSIYISYKRVYSYYSLYKRPRGFVNQTVTKKHVYIFSYTLLPHKKNGRVHLIQSFHVKVLETGASLKIWKAMSNCAEKFRRYCAVKYEVSTREVDTLKKGVSQCKICSIYATFTEHKIYMDVTYLNKYRSN